MAFSIKTQHKRYVLMGAMTITGVFALGGAWLPDFFAEPFFGTINLVRVAGGATLVGVYLLFDRQV